MVMQKRLTVLFLIMVLLPLSALAQQPEMGVTIVGTPWKVRQEGEIFTSENGISQRMVNVEGLVLPLPETGWYEDGIPAELQDPARKYFLTHRETGSYISVSRADADPELTADMIHYAMLKEMIFPNLEIIENPGGIRAVFTGGIHMKELTLVVPDGRGNVYVVETIYQKDTDGKTYNMLEAQYKDMAYWMYFAE